MSNDASVVVPVWVEFPNLPTNLGGFLQPMDELIGEFVCYEPNRFMFTRLSNRVCVRIDLAVDRPKVLHLEINGDIITQKVIYVGLPNTCFCCHSASHKIRECPLMADKFKYNTP